MRFSDANPIHTNQTRQPPQTDNAILDWLLELPLTDAGEIDGAMLIRQERALRDIELGASSEEALRDVELRL